MQTLCDRCGLDGEICPCKTMDQKKQIRDLIADYERIIMKAKAFALKMFLETPRIAQKDDFNLLWRDFVFGRTKP